MLQKIQWTQPWRFRHDIVKNWSGAQLSHYVFAELTNGTEKFDILLPQQKGYDINFGSEFYGFANRSILEEVIVIPGEELTFLIRSRIDSNDKTKVNIRKLNNSEFGIFIVKNYEPYANKPADINDYPLSKIELQQKLKYIQPTIEVYPFILPFGNCFFVEDQIS